MFGKVILKWSRLGIVTFGTIIIICHFTNISKKLEIFASNSESKSYRNKMKDFPVHSFRDTNYTKFDIEKVNLKFLPNFKSPCIFERVTDKKENVYSQNKFITEKYNKKERLGFRLKTFSHAYPSGIIVNLVGEEETNNKYRLRCMPYFMLLGVAKSGTSDFAVRATSDPNILGGINKEIFFWNQFRFQFNATIGNYMDLFDKSLNSFFVKSNISNISFDNYYNFILSEYTSTEFTDNVFWQEHPSNIGLAEPKYTNAHDLSAVNPNLKLIVLLRNPTTRLYSSYNHFNGKSPEDFHSRVVASIEWWRNCTEVLELPHRKCAYGCPPEMPPLVCVLTWKEQNNRWPGKSGNYSGEIRRGMYAIFAKDWLNIFPRNQMLFLKMEENGDMLKTFNEVVLPFLDTDGVEEENSILTYNKHRNRKTYAPMLAETRVMLDNFYAPFNNELVTLLNDAKWTWKE